MGFSRRVCLLFTLAVLPLCSSARAGLYYLDQASFQTAYPSGGVQETFEGVTPKDTALGSFTSNGITYAGLQPVGANVWVASTGYDNFGIRPAATTSAVLTSTGYELFEIDLSGVPAWAVGFDVYLNRDGPVTTNWYGKGDTLLSTFTDNRGAGLYFLGFGSDEPIYRIEWASAVVVPQMVNTGIDNVRVAPVPVPGALLLGMLGLGAAGVKLRRFA